MPGNGSCPLLAVWGLGVGFYPLRIRHAVRIARSEPSELVQFVQFDQHKSLAPDFASAGKAEGPGRGSYTYVYLIASKGDEPGSLGIPDIAWATGC